MDSEKMYKDALERAKEIKEIMYPNLSTESCKAVSEYIDAIFPELAESEDERIINAIISFLRMTSLYSSNGCKKPEMIAWLEKQKEQKPELPLMGGDTDTYFDDLRITTKSLTSREWFNEGIKYAQRLQKEQHPSSKFRSGDWLVYDGPLGHAILQIKDVVDGRYSFVDNESTLLVEDSDKFLRPLTPKDVEKPAEWSDTDNIGWDEAFACVTRAEKSAKNEEELQNAVTAEKWLKEIKFKYYVHPVKQEWSEEDEETIGTLINYFEGDALNYSANEMIRRIKSLRPSWKPNEDEERLINTTISFLKDFADKGYENAVECIDWLKSKLNGNTCE